MDSTCAALMLRIAMIVVIIVMLILLYSFRKTDNTKQWVKELNSRHEIEVSYQNPQKNEIAMRSPVISYTDLISEINIVYAYQKLVKEYESGQISSATFHELTTDLTDKIDIRDILEV